MRVIGDNNQLSEDVFDFMISYLPFPQKSICSELAKLFCIFGKSLKSVSLSFVNEMYGFFLNHSSKEMPILAH